MSATLRTLTLLVLAAVPLAVRGQDPSADLLFAADRLDLEELAREGDRFGSSVAVSHDLSCVEGESMIDRVLVAGAAQASTKGTLSGAAYVFVQDACSKRWGAEPVLKLPKPDDDTNAFDGYGYSVAVSGNGGVIAIGAPLHDGLQGNAGAVYVYERADATWTLRAKLTAEEDAEQNDQLGTALALSSDGEVLIAGAPQPNPATEPRGKAYVYQYDSANRKYLRSKLIPMEDQRQRPFDFFGFAVSLSSNGAVAVVGAPGYDLSFETAKHDQSGAVYRFVGSWSDPAQHRAEPVAKGAVGDELGFAVAVDREGNTIVAGARQAGSAQPGKGKAYVLRSPDWKLDELSCGQSFDRLGTSVAIDEDGKVALVGAPGTDTTAPSAYLFQLAKKGCIPVPACSESRETGSRFGQSVTLGGAGAAIGAPLDDARDLKDAGSVCALDLTGLDVSFSQFPTKVTPGETVSFKITVTNQSTRATPVTGTLKVTFDETKLFGAELKQETGAVAPGCRGSGRCSAIGGEGVVSTSISLRSGEHAVFTFMASVKPDASGNLHFAVMLEGLSGLDLTSDIPPTDPTLKPEADLAIVKEVKCLTDDFKPVACNRTIRGKTLQYTLTVTNQGPSQVSDAKVTDNFNPGAIAAVSWSCKALKGARCGTAKGSGKISDKPLLPVNGELVYTALAQTRLETQVRELINRAEVTSAAETKPKNNQDDVKTILPQADLRVRVFPAAKTVVPGSGAVLSAEIRFINDGEDAVGVSGENPAHIVVNLGPSNATWICRQGDQVLLSGVGQVLESDVALPAQGRIVCIVKAAIGPAERGKVQLVQRAEIEPPPEVLDLKPDNNRAPAADLLVTELTPQSALKVGVAQTGDFAVPGSPSPHKYTISVRNEGPSDLLGAKVEVRFPQPLTSVIWRKCSDGVCSDPVKGNVNDQVRLAVGESLSYEVAVLVDPAAVSTVSISVTVAAVGSERLGEDSTCTTGANQQPIGGCTITTALKPATDLAVAYAGPDGVIPGNPLPGIYTLTVTNAGPSDARHAKVRFKLTPVLTGMSWTCAATNGSCPAGGQGNVVTQDLSLRVGGTAKFTIKGTADASVTRKELTVDGGVGTQPGATDPRPDNNNLAETKVPFTPVADLTITKTLESGLYKITVFNAGPSDVAGAVVRDQPPTPVELDGDNAWTCAALNGSCSCLPPAGCKPLAAQGDGCTGGGSDQILEDTISLRVGGHVTYTLPAVNVASNIGCVTAPQVLDPRPDNNASKWPRE
jgi:uncharacterized repeat protein (TIGR01451 family)